MADSGSGSRRRRASVLMLAARDTRSGGYDFNFRMIDHMESTEGVEVDTIHHSTVPPACSGSRLLGSLHVLRRVRRFSPDVLIISKSYPYALLLRLFRLSLKAPVIHLVHHPDWLDPRRPVARRIFRWLAKWVMGMADAVWCNSRSTLDQVAALGVRPAASTVIHPGFRRAPEHLARRKTDLSGPSGPLRLLAVGNIVARKAQDVLVEACSILRERGRLFSLVLAGDSTVEADYAGRVRKMIEELFLSDSVILAGHLQEEELEKAYSAADLLVHPARWEAFGIAVAEGMSYGLPVVGSRIGGIPELVSDGHNGLLVPPGDELALANAIDSFISNRALLREMGSNSGMKANLLNDWEQTCRAFYSFVSGIAGWNDFAEDSSARTEER